MFTVDASVHISALNPLEDGSSESRLFLERVFRRPWPVFSPTLLLVEVAAAVARVFADTGRGLVMAQAVRGLPGQAWIVLDDAMAEDAARLAAESRLRGADAVYAAVAQRYGTTLVTRDHRQLERLRPTLQVMTPIEALVHLDDTGGQSDASHRFDVT
jgi:predicted nucleic acid-binding protein